MLEAVTMLTPLYYFYPAGVVVISAVMVYRRDTPAVCIAFLFLLSVMGPYSVIGGVQVVLSSTLYATNQFIEIIVIIALVAALSECLSDLGNDYLLMTLVVEIMKSPPVIWRTPGFTMLLFSLFLWPSSSVVLVGAIMLPFAVQTGLRPLATAMTINLFGYRVAPSYDLVTQGAPAISTSSAGITTAQVLSEGRPVLLIMVVTTVLVASFLNRKTPTDSDFKVGAVTSQREKPRTTETSVVLAICTSLAFPADIMSMLIFDLKGGDATSVVSGTVVLLMCFGAIMGSGRQSLEKVTDYVTDDFLSVIRIFAPVVIVRALFFLGSSGTTGIIGKRYKNGTMNDWAVWLVQHAPLSKCMTAMIQMIAGGLTGLGGSGFSGLPLTGALARTFGTAVGASVPVLTTLGQIAVTSAGGGATVPWDIIPVATIYSISPVELAKKNLASILIGFLCTFLVACPAL